MGDLFVMVHEAIAGPHMPPAQGPYSPAVRAGNLLFVSAQSGVDPDTNQVPMGGFEYECRQAFRNIARALRAVDADLRHVVKTMILYVDPQDLQAINQIFAEVFPVNPPARTSAIVRLPGGRRISVDAIAAMPD
jgi:2-iminobutanoate/2-iminopropanoate deaminase